MTRILLIICLVLLVNLEISGQEQSDEEKRVLLRNIEYSNPDLLAKPGVYAQGFPDKDPGIDILPGFKNPPPGYGEVPFWWWSGDPLDTARLSYQIEELHKKGITGMQVNYIHKDSPGWPTYPAEPEIFSDQWWKVWTFAADKAGKLNMGMGMSGYTIDWPESDNLFNKIIYSIPEIQGRELVVDTIVQVLKRGKISLKLPVDFLQVWAYKIMDGNLVPGGKSLSGFIRDGILQWIPEENDSEIWVYAVKHHPGTLNPINPLSGKTVIDKFFQEFENHSVNKSVAGLNYFFQDELKFGVDDLIWTDDFNEVFRNIKGYDVFETLPGMFRDIGPLTSKARLDFMDIKVMLSEERYFKPIFEWHWKRGKIYGCDPEGRGKDPGMYGDNFNVIRWYTAPGHDTPSGRADLIKGKVSSSIAALYNRPRVWLEGYHSLGWGATPEQLMYATCENYLYGCNLLNLHGLYYTTHGSFWEWAPPCYHFRMPYWDHMDLFLKYFERLSYLLSHGNLQADIAVLYPVSTAQARMNEKEATSIAFKSGTKLFNNGYDFLFIDDQSVIRTEIKGKCLNVSGQSFKIFILPGMKAIRWSTLKKAQEFFHNGGIVLASGSLPEASDHAGAQDPALDAIVKELFGVSAYELQTGGKPSVRIHKSGGMGLFCEDPDILLNQVKKLLPGYIQADSTVRFMFRKIGFRDVFMVMGARKGSWITFRSEGKAEQWDPWTGSTLPLETKSIKEVTMVKMPLDSNEAQLIVFTPFHNGKTRPVEEVSVKQESLEAPPPLILDGGWESVLKPTMDNRWGDFRLPVTEKLIGAEARIFRYSEETENTKGWELTGFDDTGWPRVTYGFGQKFWKLGPLPENTSEIKLDSILSCLVRIDPSQPVNVNGKMYYWTPYDFSWRLGLEGDPGHQGYHGLKEEISDDFICLGKPAAGLNETLYTREKEGSLYYLWTTAYSENVTNVTILAGGLMPGVIYLNGRITGYPLRDIVLKKGFNPLLIRYNSPGRGHFVILRDNSSIPAVRTPLSMKWYDMHGRIVFDARSDERSPAGLYRFTAPPGLKSMIIRAEGKIKVFINGELQKVLNTIYGSKPAYFVESENAIPGNSCVAIKVEQNRGNYGGSALPEPVILNCEKGIINAGDWSKGSVLENYSGGIWYKKNFKLTEEQARSEVVLDLGKVVATAEIHVNGSQAGILVTSPWKLDITPFIRKGDNKLEILVYNTLANHYLTVPTKYRGNSLLSGLLGPVKMEFRIIK
ncbi:MAG: hypothetical protein MUE74_05890 [Bacteroidales bacterium]|jgi:hypothetical protein|nr:hypothetical protein [Bacteroidales bacterium]